MGDNMNPADQSAITPAGDLRIIHCGPSFIRIGAELLTAGQCFDAIGRLMLLQSDADNDTLLKVLETAEYIEAWRSRLSPDLPTITAAERHHQ